MASSGRPLVGRAASKEHTLALLRALSRRQSEGSTQRQVATALGVSKVEARRRLRRAVSDGIVREAVREGPGAPGRRLFFLSVPRGIEELKRLERLSLDDRHAADLDRRTRGPEGGHANGEDAGRLGDRRGRS